MANGWTEERRQRQRELIQNWKPWLKSTGARTLKGKARSSRNACRTGVIEARQLIRLLNQLLKEEKRLIVEMVIDG